MISPSPILLALGGSVGTGKTTLAYGLRRAVPALHDALVLKVTKRAAKFWGMSYPM